MVPGGNAAELRAGPGGVVPSTVRDPLRVRPDRNGFVTALATRARRRQGTEPPAPWLDLLQACRVGQSGFSFWPRGAAPGWAPRLVPDTDDTSVMTLELLHAGRVGLREARGIACRGVAAHRAQAVPPGAPWPLAGMFAVWQRPGGRRELVDCTVAANALALLAATKLLSVSGVRETVAAIAAGVEWAGADPLRLSSLSPFYPEPDELRRAVSNAVSEGCGLLEPVAARLGKVGPTEPDAAICSSPYGLVTWHSPQLQAIRSGGIRPH